MDERRGLGDRLFLVGSVLGLSLIPFLYVVTGFPAYLNYQIQPWAGWVGAILELASMALFYCSHHELGRNWSVTLEIRDNHQLVTRGAYRYVRHPMYASFWLWATAQAFLLPNWLPGGSGLASVAGLYFSRIRKEEELMENAFGDDYRAYRARVGAIIPRFYR